MVEISIPVYLAGSAANFIVWTAVWYYVKKCHNTHVEPEEKILSSYNPEGKSFIKYPVNIV